MAIAVYSLAPLVGPAIGPVAGAWIGLRTTWRWVVRIHSPFLPILLISSLDLSLINILLSRSYGP